MNHFEWLGKDVKCLLGNGNYVYGKVTSIEYNKYLEENVYNCISKYGNEFTLSKREIELVDN